MFQTGFYALGNYATPYYMRGVAAPVPALEVIHPMGADPHWRALRARILREDDEILAIIMAFMEIKD